MDYGFQIRWKEDVFKQALRGIAHIREYPPLRVHPAQSEFQYRFRARLQIKGSSIGFYRRASNTIVTWERCMLLPEGLNLAVEDLRAWCRDNAIPELMSCEVAMSPVDGSVTFHWIFNKVKGNSGAARIIMDGMEEITAGKEANIAGQAAHDPRGKAVAERGGSLPLGVGGTRMRAKPGTFFQVNPDVNEILVGRTLLHLRSAGTTSLLDLYCGNGNFSLPAAAAGMKTLGVESSSKAVHDALSASGPESNFIEMDTARFLEKDTEAPLPGTLPV
jgi:23S rRNA (uracil1939-C5)-methyltransferase